MSRSRQYIEFEGTFSENVLGIFRVVRGFADLQDLSAALRLGLLRWRFRYASERQTTRIHSKISLWHRNG